MAPDGSITFGTDFEARVRQIAPDGTISTVAGTGTVGFAGDGGPATQATISLFPREAQHGADGSIYFIDGENHHVRRISPSGTISTVAGTGTGGFAAADTITGTARLLGWIRDRHRGRRSSPSVCAPVLFRSAALPARWRRRRALLPQLENQELAARSQGATP